MWKKIGIKAKVQLVVRTQPNESDSVCITFSTTISTDGQFSPRGRIAGIGATLRDSVDYAKFLKSWRMSVFAPNFSNFCF